MGREGNVRRPGNTGAFMVNHSGAIIWRSCILMKLLCNNDTWQELDSKQWDYDAVALLEQAQHGQKSADMTPTVCVYDPRASPNGGQLQQNLFEQQKPAK